MTKTKFPKSIFILRAGEGENQYWEVNENAETAGENDGDLVGVYELIFVKRLSITRKLDDS
jgi:hypothetical protein